MNSRKKPLSPHLQIYKPQITSFTSILHRLTGIFLYFGIVFICWSIVHYTYQVNMMGDDVIDCDHQFKEIFKWFSYLVIAGLVFSLYYHLCNGIRHLFWDLGKGFEIKTARKTGWLALVVSLAMTVASAAIVLL